MLDRPSMIRYYYDNPIEFVQLCMRAIRPYDYYNLEWFHRDWLKLRHDNPVSVEIAPRGFLKSTLDKHYDLWYTLFRVEQGIQPNIMVVCDNEKKVKEFTNQMATVLMSDDIQYLFGGFEVEPVGYSIFIKEPPVLPWLEIDKIQCSSIPTISCYTVNSSLTGAHINHGIIDLDDAYVSVTSTSKVQRESRLHLITHGWLALIGPDTKRLISGTIYGKDDEYLRLIEAGIPTNINSRSCYIDKQQKVSLWPSVWPREKLEERRKMIGEVAFALQYMNNPDVAVGKLIQPGLLDKMFIEVPKFDPAVETMVVGFDAAYGGGDRSACAKALVRDGKIYLVDGWEKQFANFDQKYRTVVNYANYSTIITEDNGPQKDVPDILRKYGAAYVVGYTPMSATIPLGDKQSPKAARVLETVLPLMEAGVLFVCNELIYERLLYYSGLEGDEDDLIDAVVMAVWQARKYNATGRNIVYGATLPDQNSSDHVRMLAGV